MFRSQLYGVSGERKKTSYSNDIHSGGPHQKWHRNKKDSGRVYVTYLEWGYATCNQRRSVVRVQLFAVNILSLCWTQDCRKIDICMAIISVGTILSSRTNLQVFVLVLGPQVLENCQGLRILHIQSVTYDHMKFIYSVTATTGGSRTFVSRPGRAPKARVSRRHRRQGVEWWNLGRAAGCSTPKTPELPLLTFMPRRQLCLFGRPK